MRGLFIGLGAALLARFEWIIYVFGALLVITGVRMALKQDEEFDGEQNPVVKLVRRVLPLTDGYRGKHFFVVENGRRYATPLLLVLVLVEATDLIFAVDSIPAIFGITRDPFIVFTSNIFAVLGLRSLFFLLAQRGDEVPPAQVRPRRHPHLRRREDAHRARGSTSRSWLSLGVVLGGAGCCRSSRR